MRKHGSNRVRDRATRILPPPAPWQTLRQNGFTPNNHTSNHCMDTHGLNDIHPWGSSRRLLASPCHAPAIEDRKPANASADCRRESRPACVLHHHHGTHAGDFGADGRRRPGAGTTEQPPGHKHSASGASAENDSLGTIGRVALEGLRRLLQSYEEHVSEVTNEYPPWL